LKNDLKNAGFEDCIADDIADRVNDRKVDNWSQESARVEALKEIELLLNRSRQAYDNFKQRNMGTASTGYTSMAAGSSTSSSDVM
jgi:predicted MarR family transcription regulator